MTSEAHEEDLSEFDSALDTLDCLRGHDREVEKLPGGLTNVNLKVTTSERVGRRTRSRRPGSDLLAIDRRAEHANSRAAADAGVGAPVIEYRRGPLPAGDRVHRGPHLHRRRPARRRAPRARRRRLPAAALGAALRQRLRHVRGPARLPRHRAGARLPAARPLPRVRRQGRADPSAPSPAQPTQTVPCNNDLLAGNFIDDGTKLWLIDYEYAGNNDACFELGNIWSEAGLTPEQLEELMEAYDGELLRHRVARARLWGLMSKYGWTLWGSIQHSVSAIDFDFWAWGDGEVRPSGRGVRRSRLRAPARAGEPGRLMSQQLPDASTGRHHRRRRDRDERRLPPDQAGRDRRRAARAGRAVLGHHVARRRPGRPAAREPERHPAGAVLHRALLRARGRGRAVHRLQAVRWRHGGAHRGPDDPAPSYGGDGGGLRPGVRAAHARRRRSSATR